MKNPTRFLAACAFLMSTLAYAQATRTWVSGVGDDANPCSRTAPCKTFAGAISKTATNGEISVLDPGGFGAVTITKSITINGTGTLAGILNAGTNGVIVNAVGGRVFLRDLSINGAGTGLSGVRFLAGSELHLERVSIQGQGGANGKGIDFVPVGGGELFVHDSTIATVATTGILLQNSGAASIRAVLENVKVQHATIGLTVFTSSSAYVHESEFSHCTTEGLRVDSGGVLRLARDFIGFNAAGVNQLGTGILLSFGDNTFGGTGTMDAAGAAAKY